MLVLTLACSQARPASLPTPSRLELAPQVVPLEEPSELEEAFEAEVEQATGQARYLAGAPCDRLAAALAESPTIVTQLQDYAATLKSLAAQHLALGRATTQRRVQELDAALAGLDRALASCGIRA